MATLSGFQLTEYFNLIGTASVLSANPNFTADNINSPGGVITTSCVAAGALGAVLTAQGGTSGGKHSLTAVYPAANTLLYTSNFIKFGDQPYLEVDLTMHTTQPTAIFVGLVDVLPDTTTGASIPVMPGAYNNARLADMAGFWFEDDANSDHWCAVYKGSNVDAFYDTSTAAAASGEYKLRIDVDSSRLITFKINGTTVHQSAVPLDDASVFPIITCGGTTNNTLNVSKVTVGKAY